MRKNTILCVLAVAVFALSSVGTTLAAWRAIDTSDHVINTASVQGKIEEVYNGGEGLYPGDTVEKIVNVKNTGTADSIVRVKIQKVWGSGRNEDGSIIVDDTLSTDNILIDYNTTYWMYDEADGYFYYKGALKPGETTVEPLFKEYTIDRSTGNEYANKTADILVSMECVQAAYHGISLWGKTFDDLGFTYADPEKETMVTVSEFLNPTDGFTFTPTDSKTYPITVQDLFYNFKNLLPGETISQTIKVTNSYTKTTEIFLHAEDIEQSLSPERLEQVTKLLHEYATVIVMDANGKEIYNGPIWGNVTGTGTNPDTMKNDISLGQFAAGQSKELTVLLQIDPTMGNEYADLWGLIRWVWSAEGVETPVPNPDNPNKPNNPDNPNTPNTGVSILPIVIYSSVMVISGGAVIFLLVSRKKKKDEVSA